MRFLRYPDYCLTDFIELMRPEILAYLQSQHIGVLAVEMLDGSPHGATVHFAYTESPLQFFFETHREYRKTEALFGRETSRATFVIGADEQHKVTFQLDGNVRLLTPEEQHQIQDVYLNRFPDKTEKSQEARVVFFTFLPNWWRFSDWTRPEGKLILTSEERVS